MMRVPAPIAFLSLALPSLLAVDTAGGTTWSAYGGDGRGQRYSTASQITPDNVMRLEVAWTARTGDLGVGHVSRHKRTFEATPVLWNDTLFIITGYNRVLALDAATGERRWQYDPELPGDVSYDEVAARGVSLWHDGKGTEKTCAHRIFFGTLTGLAMAIDADTGSPCTDFGRDGRVDLAARAGAVETGRLTITSPPAVIGDLVIFGSAIGDNRGVELERGTVHALNARSGDIVWTWDPIPRDTSDPARADWGGDSADRTGAANVWGPISVDVERGLVYAPTSSPSPDFYGGMRPGDNRYANSLVALEAATGRVHWHYQLVHHDVWDYDLASQPSLFSLRRNDREIDAVVQPTKTGMLFVFDRANGRPLFPIEERPVPQQGVRGEALSPTQPFSTLPTLTSHAAVTPDDAYGLAFFDKRGCAKAIQQYRTEGIFTPPSLTGTLQFPGYAGGVNWGGASVDEQRQLVLVNVMHLPAVVRLIPRDKLTAVRKTGELEGWGISSQEGTPYVMARKILMSGLDVPCTKPPWGTLVAVDLRRGEIAWKTALGTIEDIAPALVPNLRLGTPTLGGPITTASGVTFIGASADHYLRAFATQTGEELWRGRLPAAGIATPMTYVIGERQYVVIAAGGHGGMGLEQSDHLVAFALKN